MFQTDDKTAVYYLPGNNDVGYVASCSLRMAFETMKCRLGAPHISQKLNTYFNKEFGPLHQHIVISNHTFVALNAPGLVDEDYQRHAAAVSFEDWKPIADGPVAFVKELAECAYIYRPSLGVLSRTPLILLLSYQMTPGM